MTVVEGACTGRASVRSSRVRWLRRSAAVRHSPEGGIFRLGSASSLSRCRPETEPSSGASPNGATVPCAHSSCKQLASFCCGGRAGRSTASGSGSLAPLSAYILTFWLRLSPTSWRGSPGLCWHNNAAMKRASRMQQPEVKTLKLNYGDRSRLKLIPKARVGFPAEVCESERGDGERSRQRVRDQVARMALWGRDANEIERARISMMARRSKAPSTGRIQKRKTNFSKASLSACNARPVHTDGPTPDSCSAANKIHHS